MKKINIYLNKKVISYCIVFETDIFIEIVICVVLDSKKNNRQGKAQVFYKFRRDENLQ